jgi:ABC-2 type transport system permease protein
VNEIAAPAPEGTPDTLPARRAGVLRRVGRSAASWLRNPIVLKELRGRMRGWRAPVVMTVQLIVMGCFASLIYFAVVEGTQSSGSGSIGQTLGQTLFYSTYMLLLVLVVFLSPAFTAGTISGERERKTLDLLITTLLSARSLVLGKLVSALAYIVLLILVALPIQSLALMFGGVVFSEMVVGTLILLVTALAAGSIGVLVSSLMRSSIASTVLTYAAILLFAIGLPVVILMMTGFLSNVLDRVFNDLNWVILAVLIYVGGFLLCTNPFATAVATKLVEDEENTLFFFTTQLPDAQGNLHTIPLVSPWIVYILFYTALSALLIAASILILRRKRG